MKLFKNNKTPRRLGIAMITTLALTTVVSGTSLTKKIDATFRNIKTHYNNQAKTMAQEPFIYNDSVYLPVRAVAELVDKNVHWDSAKNSVYISDKGPSTNTLVQQLQSEIASKNFEITKVNAEKAQLEKEIKDLKDNVKEEDNKVGDLKATEKYLEDKFGFRSSTDINMDIDWDFRLTERNSRIYADVTFDSRTDGRAWDRLSLRDQESFFRSVSREIRYDHRDALINGTVVDRRTDKIVATFDYSRSDSFTYRPEASALFSDFEKDVARIYRDIGGIVDVDKISLEGDEKNIVFTVSVNLKSATANYAWITLEKEELYEKNSPISSYMTNVTEAIIDEFPGAKVDGYIEDTANRNEIIASYERGSLRKPSK